MPLPRKPAFPGCTKDRHGTGTPKSHIICVPHFALEHFWDEPPAGAWEFWGYRQRPDCQPGDLLTFTVAGVPVASAQVHQIEEPGQSACNATGRWRNAYKVFWAPESFADLREGKRPFHTLYEPPDAEAAHKAWKATCGPCMLAAMLRVPVNAVRKLFPEFPSRDYTNLTAMKLALYGALVPYNVVKATELAYGLAQVQFTGPWSQPEVNPKVSYLHTHWIGLATTPEYGLLAYEINAGSLEHIWGQWVPMAFWESEVLPLLLTQHPRADGGYHFRWTCELYI